MKKKYVVTWDVEVESETPKNAAQVALKLLEQHGWTWPVVVMEGDLETAKEITAVAVDLRSTNPGRS